MPTNAAPAVPPAAGVRRGVENALSLARRRICAAFYTSTSEIRICAWPHNAAATTMLDQAYGLVRAREKLFDGMPQPAVWAII
uniref:Uncharacterized protein n=1 Tax=Leersia perrieri TaxID=77586 RepID=A0A0D9W8R6_9ORYZ